MQRRVDHCRIERNTAENNGTTAVKEHCRVVSSSHGVEGNTAVWR
jgi:hypothetical protein